MTYKCVNMWLIIDYCRLFLYNNESHVISMRDMSRADSMKLCFPGFCEVRGPRRGKNPERQVHRHECWSVARLCACSKQNHKHMILGFWRLSAHVLSCPGFQSNGNPECWTMLTSQALLSDVGELDELSLLVVGLDVGHGDVGTSAVLELSENININEGIPNLAPWWERMFVSMAAFPSSVLTTFEARTSAERFGDRDHRQQWQQPERAGNRLG